MKASEPLPAEVRQSRIRSYVNEHEFVRVSDISERFGISEVTARADLTALEDRGFVRRVHGGAVPRQVHRTERPFDLAQDNLVADLAHLGQAGAALVKPGDAVLIDVGTTTTALARARRPRRLVHHRHLGAGARLARAATAQLTNQVLANLFVHAAAANCSVVDGATQFAQSRDSTRVGHTAW